MRILTLHHYITLPACITAVPLPTCSESQPNGNYSWTLPISTESLLSCWLVLLSEVRATARISRLGSADEPPCSFLLGNQPRTWVGQIGELVTESALMKGGPEPLGSFTLSSEPPSQCCRSAGIPLWKQWCYGSPYSVDSDIYCPWLLGQVI